MIRFCLPLILLASLAGQPVDLPAPRTLAPSVQFYQLDTTALESTFHRVEYPIDTAADSIREAGLPEHLADRLYQGH